MTLIAQGNNWWIESFTVARASIATVTIRETTHPLERAGVFLGANATMDHDLAIGEANAINLCIRNTNDSELTIGQNITALESVVSNAEGGARIVGEHVLIFMRKP